MITLSNKLNNTVADLEIFPLKTVCGFAYLYYTQCIIVGYLLKPYLKFYTIDNKLISWLRGERGDRVIQTQ